MVFGTTSIHVRSLKAVGAVHDFGRMGTASTRPDGHRFGQRPRRKVSRWPPWPTASLSIMTWNDTPNQGVYTGMYVATRGRNDYVPSTRRRSLCRSSHPSIRGIDGLTDLATSTCIYFRTFAFDQHKIIIGPRVQHMIESNPEKHVYYHAQCPPSALISAPVT